LLADHVQAYAELATVQIARADLRVLRMAGAA
jgi:hypothetical protein